MEKLISELKFRIFTAEKNFLEIIPDATVLNDNQAVTLH